MATTAEIKGLFSKEHVVLVLLICGSYWFNYNAYNTSQTVLLQQAEIQADIKILTFQINNKNEKKLALTNSFRQERQSEYQTTVNVDSSLFCDASNRYKSRY
ncbi:hypothetical protein DWB61_03725 [Ancylomarina euxinus]|uniref:Uncharacterized protein n=1 Tax=Ancylomarina euxinus TaxID=2283627 RepID=A0A425Y794_9BACT|nr:hypothetical protein [Ancylomarina euxinus]MBI9035467.1 hypothetical protein [Bacteroidales bacterium]MCZ4693890.1 hypothetical protein [Ancylomarina euxinus]MUP14690.1 hypothetical protein [Ancylomarina euxinus]RRG24235.1 hypothetical protein DWB61_03725 [Ancylomarina euxinus]